MSEKGLSLKQNMLWNALGSTVYLACQWLCTMLCVRLSPDLHNSGILSLAMTVSAIFYCVAAFNMRSFQVSDGHFIYKDGTYTLSRMLLFALALISCFLFSLASGYTGEQLPAIMLYMLFKVSEALADLIGGAAQRRERMDIEGKSFLLRGILGTLAFGLTLHFAKNITLAIGAMALLTYAVIFLFQIPQTQVLCDVRPSRDFKVAWQLIGTCFLMFVSSILYNSIVSVPRLFLENIHGKEMLAIYANVATPALLVQTLCAYIYNPLLTRFTSLYNNKEFKPLKEMVFKCLVMIVSIVLAALFASWLWGEFGLRLLYNESIAAYHDLLYFMVINTGLTAIVWFFSSLAIVLRRVKGLILASIAGMGICLLASWVLVPAMGMDGASLAGIVAQGLEITLLGGYLFHVLKKEARNG